MRVGFLGPAGTFSHEALLRAGWDGVEPVEQPTLHDAVLAVQGGAVDVALVPFENAIEGAVNPVLDALVFEAPDVRIAGELVHRVRHCLIAAAAIELGAVRRVVSHPQASAQCARFLREQLAGVPVVAASSTAEAVRTVAGSSEPDAALGPCAAAELYGCTILREGVEDDPDNVTRFVWLARGDESASGVRGGDEPAPRDESASAVHGGDEPTPRDESASAVRGGDEPAPGDESRVVAGGKTALVFWGQGSNSPGWLVACLAEFADRGVNLTRIESRPLRRGLGNYLFLVELDGAATTPAVADAIVRLRGHADVVRVLGSY